MLELSSNGARYLPNLADLVREHHALLYRYAYRLTGASQDAEDLTQQTFLIAQQKLTQLRDPARARSWLCAIVRNTFLKNRRNLHGRPWRSLEQVAEPAASAPDEPDIDSDELQAVLDEMPVEFRLPLVMFYFGDVSYKEIAAELEIPIGTVMSRLARGKEHLRRRLRKPLAVQR